MNEIVPVSHPIFWFGTILTQKSNNKNYSNGANRILTIKIIPTMPKPIKQILFLRVIMSLVIDPFYINRVKKLRFLSFFLVDCIVHDPCHKEIF